MAIRGVGVDIVHIPRIEAALRRWGDRFRRKVFTENEILAARNRPREGKFLAMRFAAKEAFAKATGMGMRSPLKWHAIEVKSDDLGRPEITVSEDLRKWCETKNIRHWHLSLSDDNDHAIAVVILEGD
ncbi:MAG: holo-ACP synthase [Thermodesulforhabdaceae bacterium]|jgi:holo-[acyl-carrier protein] synthase